MRTFLACIYLILFSSLAYALPPRLEPAVVHTAVGEHFHLQVHISDPSGADCRIYFPASPSFEMREAGVTQTQSVRIVGGQVEHTQTWIRNYTLRAKEVGQFTLGPARCTIADREHRTGIAVIHVQANQGRSQPGTGVRPGGIPSGIPSVADFFFREPPRVREDDRIEIYVETLFDKKTAWVGESVVQYVDIHASRPRISNVQFAQISRDGFWEILPERYEQIRPLRYTRDGKEWYRYRYAVAYLFPLTGGERIVSPFAVRIEYNQFWTRTRIFQTDILRLNARSLPYDADRSFSGAVGTFDIAGHLDEYGGDFMQDKPFALVLTVSGFGNARSIQAPIFSENADFRIMPPQLNSQVRIRDGRIYGSQSFRYLIYPLRAGVMRLPDARLRAFDPEQARYYDLVYTSSPLEIKPAQARAQDDEGAASVRNYYYDFTPPKSDYPPSVIPFAPGLSLALLSGALGFFFCGILRERRRRYNENNPRLALRVSSAKRARAAFRALPKDAPPEEIASSLARALRAYVSDRTGVSEGATFAVLAEALIRDQVCDIEDWKAFEEHCTALSYGRGHADPSALYTEAERILRYFEESRS
jgi:hypothetical protein